MYNKILMNLDTSRKCNNLDIPSSFFSAKKVKQKDMRKGIQISK